MTEKEKAIRLRPKRYRRARAKPEAGWALLTGAAQRLGLWVPFIGYAARRSFAVACHKLVPRLEPHARAEAVEADEKTLLIRVSSSAVASELVYVKDLLLEEVNRELGMLLSSLPKQRSKRPKPVHISRLQYRVGPVKALPDFAAWSSEVETRSAAKKPKPRPPAPWNLDVAAELRRVRDTETRDALAALYAAATREG